MEEHSKANAVENFLVKVYMASVCLSPLGPVVHYGLWAVCLVLMIFGRVKYGVSLRLKNLDRTGKIVLACWVALSLWTAVAGLLTFHDLNGYGRNVTIFLEVTLGMYFAARFFIGEANRQKLLRFFVLASLLVVLGNLLRELEVIDYFPNRSLQNGNALGMLSVLLLPLCVCYAFGCVDGLVRRMVIVIPPCLAVVLSFSSGAWLAAAFSGIFLLFWCFKSKKMNFSFVAAAAFLLLCAVAVVNIRSGQNLWRRVAVEIRQVTSFRDMGTFTTYRNEIWNASAFLIRRRPLTGWGGKKYSRVYDELFKTQADRLGLKNRPDASHPHSTFLYVAYLAGLPGLALFLTACALSLKKALRLMRVGDGHLFPWGAMFFALFSAVLVYALTGDVLTGRRDISVMLWCFWGILLILPQHGLSREKS